jgi:hypothetical protein
MSKTGKYWLKRVLIAVVIIGLLGAGVAWYLINEKFSDTQSVKADYTVDAPAFIKEFEKDAAGANKKYTDKIVAVSGIVAATENPSDTITNIKFTDTATGSYAIFAFQGQHLKEAQQVKEGDKVAIKGSCSGGNFSEILGFTSIEFKRCALETTSK